MVGHPQGESIFPLVKPSHQVREVARVIVNKNSSHPGFWAPPGALETSTRCPRYSLAGHGGEGHKVMWLFHGRGQSGLEVSHNSDWVFFNSTSLQIVICKWEGMIHVSFIQILSIQTLLSGLKFDIAQGLKGSMWDLRFALSALIDEVANQNRLISCLPENWFRYLCLKNSSMHSQKVRSSS